MTSQLFTSLLPQSLASHDVSPQTLHTDRTSSPQFPGFPPQVMTSQEELSRHVPSISQSELTSQLAMTMASSGMEYASEDSSEASGSVGHSMLVSPGTFPPTGNNKLDASLAPARKPTPSKTRRKSDKVGIYVSPTLPRSKKEWLIRCKWANGKVLL